MSLRHRNRYHRELHEALDKIREEHKANGETENFIVVTEEELQRVKREIDGIEEPEQETRKTPVGNIIMGVLILVSLILFFVGAFKESDNMLGFALSGLVLAPAFATTVRDSHDPFKRERKVTWKFRIWFILFGGLLLWGAISQTFGSDAEAAVMKVGQFL